jgi:hypothetical protein
MSAVQILSSRLFVSRTSNGILDFANFKGNKAALRIPSHSFQYLRRPGCTAKLLCFQYTSSFDPHRPYQFSYRANGTCENHEAAKGSFKSECRRLGQRKSAARMASRRSELILQVTHFPCALHHRRRPGQRTDRGLPLAGKTRARTSDSAGWPRHAIETRVGRSGVPVIRSLGRQNVFHLLPSPPVVFL